jgi:transposase
MFVRVKKMKNLSYLQIVESRREGDKVKQHVFATLGRQDLLAESGKIDDLARSLLKFAPKVRVIDAHRAGTTQVQRTLSVGPALVFDRLWRELGLKELIEDSHEGAHHQFSIERAIFLTVLHRLFDSGSDRSAESWKEDYLIEGAQELELQHLYRAMGWLGEELPSQESPEAGLPLRCRKDLLEERLFARNRDLFSAMDLVFFDTSSLYFEGEGGESLGQYGHSKDHRSDERQMIVGVVVDGAGRPICCQMWPGNVTDVTTLVPMVNRLRRRFSIGSVCVVADRGMISRETIRRLETEHLSYILGVRMRRVKEVRIEVLQREGRWRVVHPERTGSKDPSPLKVREEWVGEKRYVVCFNPEQARKDAHDRQAILASLSQKLKGGGVSLVGNKGYRRYVSAEGPGFTIDERKVKEDARFDGKWVLQTNTDLPASEVALKYKQLLMVEMIFRSMKSVLETRPIYHKCDDTIRGHVFCSFLALVLMKELQSRLQDRGRYPEWEQIKRDLRALQEVEVKSEGSRWYLRTELRGVCHQVLQAAGVAVPPSVRNA